MKQSKSETPIDIFCDDHRTEAPFLTHPFKPIKIAISESSESSKVWSLSEEGCFLWLAHRYQNTSQGFLGMDSSEETALREQIRRLLGEWLSIASVSSESLH